MSNTLVGFLGIYVTCLLGAVFFPPLGIWGFLFESNFHPPLHNWGDPLKSLDGRWSLMIGVAAIGGAALHWGNYSDNRPFAERKTWILFLFVVNCYLVSLLWAQVPEKSLEDSQQFLNWFLVYIIIVKTHASRQWMPVVLYIYILSAIHMGWDETWNPSRGRTVKQGPLTAFGENFASAHMVALMPIAGFFALSAATHRYLRIVFFCGLPFMANIIAHSQSRGAMLALAAVAVAALVISTGKVRSLVLVGIVLGSILAARLTTDQFWNRAETIAAYEEDGSATGRIDAWNAASKLTQRWPLGYGAEAFDSGLGAPLMEGGFHTTHNQFFESLVAWGIQGTALFYLAIWISLWQCVKIRRKYWDPQSQEISRPIAEAYGCGLAIIGMLVASFFLNRMRWELWWIIMAYTTCMQITYLHPQADSEDDEADHDLVDDHDGPAPLPAH